MERSVISRGERGLTRGATRLEAPRRKDEKKMERLRDSSSSSRDKFLTRLSESGTRGKRRLKRFGEFVRKAFESSSEKV